MTEIDRVLAANEAYVKRAPGLPSQARPTRCLAVITCMDTRIDVLGVLGLSLGEAHVIRNAGGRVSDDVLRSLALSIHALGVDTVVVMQHTRCGLEDVTNDTLATLTGVTMDFLPIAHHEASMAEDVERLTSTEFLWPLRHVAGVVHDVESGMVSEVVRWSRPPSA